MHEYLVEQINRMLRRSGMYGEVEAALWLAINHLLFLEGRSGAWKEQTEAWEAQGLWTSIGVKGAFRAVLPANRESDNVASVYAEFARRQGWLRPDRVLDAGEYAALRDTFREWARHDRVWADVTAAFGAPSVLFGGTNPLYGKTLAYLTEDPAEPMVCFHLWNGADPGSEDTWPPSHQEPLLLAVRCGDGDFQDRFTFTPEGRSRRPEFGCSTCEAIAVASQA
ncbi:hypothetical protein ACIQAC_25065 [Streptomyces sp. NPDC088387]|uniref:hypothetical protein n=1 Tax=Streptomyces sp. NPDC088387 TaxID=3365859 RepID=UPI0037F61347